MHDETLWRLGCQDIQPPQLRPELQSQPDARFDAPSFTLRSPIVNRTWAAAAADNDAHAGRRAGAVLRHGPAATADAAAAAATVVAAAAAKVAEAAAAAERPVSQLRRRGKVALPELLLADAARHQPEAQLLQRRVLLAPQQSDVTPRLRNAERLATSVRQMPPAYASSASACRVIVRVKMCGLQGLTAM